MLLSADVPLKFGLQSTRSALDATTVSLQPALEKDLQTSRSQVSCSGPLTPSGTKMSDGLAGMRVRAACFDWSRTQQSDGDKERSINQSARSRISSEHLSYIYAAETSAKSQCPLENVNSVAS